VRHGLLDIDDGKITAIDIQPEPAGLDIAVLSVP